jgi:DNA integrity scanning protein DisA with diadenylate cyclase activity
VGFVDAVPAARKRRLHEEVLETGVVLAVDEMVLEVLLAEIDYALRPHIHERRVPSVGAIVEPRTDPSTWEPGTRLAVSRRPVGPIPIAGARRFADGLSSWLIRRIDGTDEWAVFDRPAGSERDLVVLADVFGATIVQRHPIGTVRVIGAFGVLRSDGLAWRLEPPVADWIQSVTSSTFDGDHDVIERLLAFAIHDLSARGIGATLIYRPFDDAAPPTDEPYPVPPAFRITEPIDLAPLRHVLAQVDGATFFDARGALVRLGSRLLPSTDARESVEAFRGTRHTSGRRYSYDDPAATVVVVSEDGPVTVLRNGEVLGTTSSIAIEARRTSST